MAKLQDLYMGKCLEDLKHFYDVGSVLKNKPPEQLHKSALKIIEEADSSRLRGDEERSYVLYMKYFGIIQAVRDHPEYKRKKSHYANLFESIVHAKKVMDQAEKLSKNLKTRYEQLKEDEELAEEINIPDNQPETNFTKTSITCEELFQMIHSQNILILDCRPKDDFLQSSCKYNFCMNVPESICFNGMTAGKIQQGLSTDDKKLWASRDIKEHVVLLDWNSPGPEPTLNSPMYCLKNILVKWDMDVVYKSILMVEKGFEMFVITYPMLVTNPIKGPPRTIYIENDGLDDIEYPSINDITMKDNSFYSKNYNFESSTEIPSIDRGSKAAAVRTYARDLNTLKIQESLIDKTLENEKEVLEIEFDLKVKDLQLNDSTNDEAKKFEILEDQRQSKNKLLELETYQKDLQIQIQQLEFENKRKDEKLQSYELDKTKSDEKLREMEQRMSEKVQETESIRLEHEKMAQDRIKADMQNKRKLKPSYDSPKPLKMSQLDNITAKPIIPQFDRGIKPNTTSDFNQNIQRDFAPVYGCPGRGLTGLKNLGNTCYMNSIVQCISNTSELNEYLSNGDYRKHINRDNKTQGKIAEEVAAVIRALWCGEYKFIAKKDLRQVVGQCQQIFRGSEQQDSHEFLTILMDWLHLDLQTLDIYPEKENLLAPEKAWIEFMKSKESYISRLFYGQIKSMVKCKKCEKESSTYDTFSNLSLELPHGNNKCRIQDCLSMYFNGELINGWYCSHCKKHRDAIKKLDISRLPSILVVHFKRFNADAESMSHNTYKKKQNFVHFPLNDLNMTEYITKNQRSQNIRGSVYNLYAVSNHYGSMESGHYTAFCKSSVFQKWYKYDDHVISPMDPSNVISSAGYILFYTRHSVTPPKEIRS